MKGATNRQIRSVQRIPIDRLCSLGGWDGERGTVTSGGRGYYLMGGAVLLQQALIQFSLHMLAR